MMECYNVCWGAGVAYGWRCHGCQLGLVSEGLEGIYVEGPQALVVGLAGDSLAAWTLDVAGGAFEVDLASSLG